MNGPRSVRTLLLGMGWFPDETGGLDRYFRGLVQALPAQGVEPRAVVVGPAADAPGFVTAVGDRHDPLPQRLWAVSRAAARLGGGADVVHAHFALYALLPVVFGKLRRKPLIVQFQGPWADEARASGDASRGGAWLRRLIERSVYRRAAEAVVLSAAFRRILVQRYGVPPWNVSVVPPGVDLDRYTPGGRAQARRALGLDEADWVAFTARRLVRRVGVHVLLDAWANVAQGRSDRRLLVAGDGPERAALERQAERIGIRESVRFLGNLGDEGLVTAYRAADVSVVPSLALEGFGIVCLESLACGTPVIATDSGGLPEVLAPLEESLIVPRGDAEALARRLRGAADGSAPLPRPERCRAYSESFTWTAAAERHAAIYRRALAPPAERPLRVVYLDHSARLAGGELALAGLLRALDGVDTHVIVAEEGPFVGRLLRDGFSVEVFRMREAARGLPRGEVRGRARALLASLATVGHALRLARRLRALRPDLVHTNSLKAAVYGGVAGRLAGIPVVWHVHDRIEADYLPGAAVSLVRRLSRHFPSAVIANSQTTLATLPGARGGTVVPNPIPLPPARADERRPGPLRVGMVGRIAPWKGQHVFLEAFARAFRGGDEQAVIVGAPLFGTDEDAYADELHALSRRLGLDGRVDFAGHSDRVDVVLDDLDMLVHASVLPEPFGRVVAEGMAAGLPVVAAETGGPAEFVEHERNGLLYPPGDAAALAAALARLARDEALRRRLGAEARADARAFAPERVATDVLAVYRKVAEART